MYKRNLGIFKVSFRQKLKIILKRVNKWSEKFKFSFKILIKISTEPFFLNSNIFLIFYFKRAKKKEIKKIVSIIDELFSSDKSRYIFREIQTKFTASSLRIVFQYSVDSKLPFDQIS